MAQQDQIAADVAVIGDALNTLAQDITDLSAKLAAQVPENVDLAPLDALAQRAKDLAAATATPAAPAAPAATDTPATDTTAVDGSGTPTGTAPPVDAPADVNPAPTL